MEDSKFGKRDNRNHYLPNKMVGYPPVFVWPFTPIRALKWIFSIPGYFLPWNAFYVLVGVLTWWLLSPPLEQMKNPSVFLLLLIYLRNCALVTIYYGAFHFVLYIKKNQGISFKFNPQWPPKSKKRFIFGNQNIDNIIWTFASGVIIWTSFEVIILYLAANQITNNISIIESPVYFLTIVLTVHFWRDLHFYLIHRLIHWKPLYKIAHHIHHKNSNPGPWSGLAMHPVEHIMYFSCAFLYIFLPFHPIFAIVTLVHAGLSPAPGHAGFERVKINGGKSVDIDAHAHYLHHKYFECNYADGILPLDKWFGTFHDGTKESQLRMRDRLKENYNSPSSPSNS